ncbi:uncharacterized protein LOC119089724 [Pollicipes pollicipes]|uniref:uncharacterized protein LOC119089724 n=1 Tax=Pollicipes pollicipes TaxID=41117 RepID=UPI0018855B1E|nr:uncharacterized protein LOC119089724 [Pollicipes pollicipes]
MTEAASLDPLCWVAIVSVTMNAIGASAWLLTSLRAWSRGRDTAAADAARATCVACTADNRMFRVVDLVLSQALALYALVMLLWLPLLEHSFLPANDLVSRYMAPALCVAIGRHVFCCCRGWRAGRSAVPSLTHAVSAVCLGLFLYSGRMHVLAALALTVEIGGIYSHLMGLVGERRAARLPSWVPGLGVILSLVFNGLVYLVVLALALARRSPTNMPPLDVSLFFFFITYSFIMNTYSIYVMIASFFNMILEERMASTLRLSERQQQERGQARPLPAQAVANIRSALAAAANPARPAPDVAPGLADVKSSDSAVLVTNMV